MRAQLLLALLGGVHRSARDLSRQVGVPEEIVGGHLRVLLDAGLVSLTTHDGLLHYGLSGPDATRAVESLDDGGLPDGVTGRTDPDRHRPDA